jgi:hypothetical protein
MRESDILHEAGPYWVCRDGAGFTVYRNGMTHSKADSSYVHIDLAMVRADYLAARDRGLDSAQATQEAMGLLRARAKGLRA